MTQHPDVAQRRRARLVQTWLAPVLLTIGAMLASAGALAIDPGPAIWGRYAEVTNGFSNCSYEETYQGGFHQFSVSISFKNARESLTNPVFPHLYSRGFMVYHYDKDGAVNVSDGKQAPRSIFMVGLDRDAADRNWIYGEVHLVPRFSFDLHYSGRIDADGTGSLWEQDKAFTARVDVVAKAGTVPASRLAAIAIRAVNMSTFNVPQYKRQVGEIIYDTKLVYIRQGDLPGVCHIITDPGNPPPMEARINMNAPDWNLGELPPGEKTERPFSGTAEQLCFTYDGPKLAGLRYAINATNQNGLTGDGRYQLKHQASPSDAVPYRVVLQNAASSSQIELPNTRNLGSTLANSGRECFNPTFTAEPPKGAKDGDYSDVLTFTVVARP